MRSSIHSLTFPFQTDKRAFKTLAPNSYRQGWHCQEAFKTYKFYVQWSHGQYQEPTNVYFSNAPDFYIRHKELFPNQSWNPQKIIQIQYCINRRSHHLSKICSLENLTSPYFLTQKFWMMRDFFSWKTMLAKVNVAITLSHVIICSPWLFSSCIFGQKSWYDRTDWQNQQNTSRSSRRFQTDGVIWNVSASRARWSRTVLYRDRKVGFLTSISFTHIA